MIVIWGGTFDPVHNAHIELAKRVVESLDLEKLYLMPCYQAVHKENVSANPLQRLEMLEFAIHNEPCLFLDKREINKKSAAFTYDSLSDIRIENPDESLCFIMGEDAGLSLSSWYKAEQMHDITNIIIVNRPTESYVTNNKNSQKLLSDKSLENLGFLAVNNVEDLKKSLAGKYINLNLGAMNISSSDIRYKAKHNQDITCFVHNDVHHYIRNNNLYSK